MFLGGLNTVFLDISKYLPHLELRNGSIKTVIIANFIVISNFGIKRFDCILNPSHSSLNTIKRLQRGKQYISERWHFERKRQYAAMSCHFKTVPRLQLLLYVCYT